MNDIGLGFLLRAIVLQSLITGSVTSIQKREWLGATTWLAGDVVCFSEYMEMWIQHARIEGLRVWLTKALKIPVNLASLDQLNLQLSVCGFSLHKDPDQNFIFRVTYTGCFVQQQIGFHVLTLNLMREISRFEGRPRSLIMKCPVGSVLPSKEKIQCDPENIQVIKQVPHDNWNNELQWSLSLSDRLIVALEDSSLIQMNVMLNGVDITVQGRRSEVLNPVTVMDNEAEFLALKLVSGRYAYSMEAVCPKVSTSVAEVTVLHIFKRRMGLIKRSRLDQEELTVRDVSVNQTKDFSVHETSEFVTLVVPTDQIIQTKTCTNNPQLLQSFYRVDVVLTFKETNHKMHWSMENTLPCTEGLSLDQTLSSRVPEEELTAFSTNSSSSHSEEKTDAQPGSTSSDVDSDSVPHISATTDLSLNGDTEHEQDSPQINRNAGNQERRKPQWVWEE